MWGVIKAVQVHRHFFKKQFKCIDSFLKRERERALSVALFTTSCLKHFKFWAMQDEATFFFIVYVCFLLCAASSELLVLHYMVKLLCFLKQYRYYRT